MDLEREPWFLPASENYREQGNDYFGQNNRINYSNEELQVKRNGGK